ncbi:unnamed protein product [Prunus armeniaca]
MAQGVPFDLAIPVLALQEFLSSSSEKSTPIMARFSGRLLAKFFEDSTARALFWTCDKVEMSRLARENYRVIQPYSPHRFSRQFWYVQHALGELKDDICNGTVLLVYSHWKSCLNVGTASTINLPAKDNI